MIKTISTFNFNGNYINNFKMLVYSTQIEFYNIPNSNIITVFSLSLSFTILHPTYYSKQNPIREHSRVLVE